MVHNTWKLFHWISTTPTCFKMVAYLVKRHSVDCRNLQLKGVILVPTTPCGINAFWLGRATRIRIALRTARLVVADFASQLLLPPVQAGRGTSVAFLAVAIAVLVSLVLVVARRVRVLRMARDGRRCCRSPDRGWDPGLPGPAPDQEWGGHDFHDRGCLRRCRDCHSLHS